MGCCSTKNDVKSTIQKNAIPTQQNLKKKGNDSTNKGGPHLNDNEKIGEKQRIDTPQITEENNRSPLRQGDFHNDISKSIGGQGNAKYQYFDISPKVVKKNKIYNITSVFPVNKPYSNQSDWQKLLSKIQMMSEEELILKILGLRNRNWVQEQIKLQIESSNSNMGSLEGLVISRKFIQLREHFNWLVWAVAQFYFQQKFENKFNLPKLNNQKWTEGFDFKGIFIKVLPFEDAYFVFNEMQALKYVQMELLELQSLAPSIIQQYGNPKENLLKDVILPLISGISCGGFFLFASPTIYTQELDQTKEIYKETLQASRIAGLQNSIVQLGNNNFNGSAQQMQAIQNQSNVSFSYLHNNINADFVQDSMFKFMPILKNLGGKNMIPIIDFDEFNAQSDDQKFQNTEIKYLLVHLFDILPQLSETSASTILLRFPCYINEEISLHQFPKNKYMEIKEISRLISSKNRNGMLPNDNDFSDDENQIGAGINKQNSSGFTKKFFSKHGWDFILMQKQNPTTTSENKRATQFYNSREIPPFSQQDYISVANNYVSNNNQQEQAQNQNNLQVIKEQENNLNNSRGGQFLSPQKNSILRNKVDYSSPEQKVIGTSLVAAYHFKRDFKVIYSMIGHTYSTNIESMYGISVDQCCKIIEQSDNIYNSKSLKELLHRKGLNIRFLWVILSKLRSNQAREMVMVDILVRVMRKVINEEVKLKAKVQQASGDEFFQGNQIDIYKETICFYINAILKRKFQKYRQVFDETLQGLFLSRLSIITILYSLSSIRREEIHYMESRQILEDVIEAPSKTPVIFINAIKDYFKIEFKPEFLRLCRQDKHLVLSKSQPLTLNDIKGIQLRCHNYFEIKDQAYFMLARSITHNSKGSPQKLNSKIKTKTEKDKMKQSFQKPQKNNDISIQSQRGSSNSKIGPQGAISSVNGHVNDSTTTDQQDSKTARTNIINPSASKDQLSTIRQYKNMDKEVSQLSTQKKGLGPTQLKNEQPIIDLSNISKRNSFKPSQIQEIIIPSILYKLKTFLSNNPMYYFDDSSKTYIGDTFTVLKSYYEMPNIDIVNEWVIIMESLLKDVYSVNGSEQVLLEAFVYQAILIYFFEKDYESLYKVLAKIRDMLFISNSCSPESVIVMQILTGLFFEDQKDQPQIEAEKSYLTSLICIFQLYGDPRGRGNIGVPFTLYLSWKLSLLSSAEDKKLHDSEFAEEIFDASLKTLNNHRKLYKEHQLLQLYQNQLKQSNQAIDIQISQYEIQVENLEQQKQIFDISKYSSRPSTLTIAGGISKSNSIISGIQKKGQSNLLNLPQIGKENSIKSKSYVPQAYVDKNQSKHIDINEIDLEIEDENRNFFVQENFKNVEWFVGTCPFQHWSLYRQQIAQILQAHNSVLNKNSQAQTQYQKQIYKEMLQKSIPKDIFYQWLIKFNPIMYQSGMQWNNAQIKEIIFCQNQQMVSSSGSSVILSNHNMSHQSLSSIPSSAKEKKTIHLGSYSQILGKENGGISKQEMSGIVFTWGSDVSGQLGLDVIASSNQTNISLKVLYPRMVLSLRDEIIKEICCGHSHTMAINIHGNVFVWGLNEQAQLGLGQESPKANIVKLSAGNEHSIAVTKTGELYIWGGGGLTGTGDIEKRHIPTKLDFFSKIKILQAVCGGLHTIVLSKDGDVYSWGSTEGGQLGLSQQTLLALTQSKEIPVLTPQKIPKLQGIPIVQVACGEAHTIVMSKDGDIYGWGMSNYGQLGLGFSSDSFEPGVGMEKSKVYEPQEITALKNEKIQKIICGATFSLFQSEKGELYGCGMNDLGQLGLETYMEDIQTLEKIKKGKHHHTTDVSIPTRVLCFQGIALHSIACGENHALGVSGDEKNMLWAWGMFKNGQLGLGEVQMKMNPRPVQTLCSSFIQRIACGSMHSSALIGESNNISTYSPSFYASNDGLINLWQCDIRALNFRDSENSSEFNNIDDQVPDDGEGKVKNPL